METPVIIPGLKESVIETCGEVSWKSTKTLLLQWLKEDTVEYQQLISIPEDINVIIYASYNGYIELISLFVKNGFPVNYKIGGGSYPYYRMLHLATIGRQIPLIKYLISSGADVSSCPYSGRTPLHSLFTGRTLLQGLFIESIFFSAYGQKMCLPKIQNSQIDVMKCLLQSGCNVNLKDRSGTSPAYYAVEQRNVDAVKFLIDNGADVNITNNFGVTPLFCSIISQCPSFEIVELLLNAGANINLRCFSNSTVLHCAMRTASQNIVELLLERGANVNSKNDLNQTPLYEYAFLLNPIVDDVEDSFVGEDGINIVGTLIIWGADTNIFDNHGRTLLHWAAWQGNIHLVKLLIDRGLDVKDEFGKKAIHYAADCSHHEVVHCFIDYYYSKMSS